jgi:hypothetical protein
METRDIVATAAVAVAVLSLAYTLSGSPPHWLQPVATAESSLLFVLGGFAVGVAITAFAYGRAQRNAPTSWTCIVLFCAAIVAVAAVRTDQLSFGQALPIVILGGVAVIAASAAIARFEKGDRVEMESHWGGLGGGLGGWRISAVTILSLLALAFAGAAVVAARSVKPRTTGTTQTTGSPGSGGTTQTTGSNANR